MLRAFLPSSLDLVRAAAQCRHAAVLWVVDTSLIVRACAGQLLVLTTITEGISLETLFGPDDPSILHTRRALQGEVVPYTRTRDGRAWLATLAPIFAGRHLIGAIGNAFLADQQRETTPDRRERPMVFQCVRSGKDCEAGDIVTATRAGGVRMHRPLPQRRFDVLLASGALVPMRSDPASEVEDRQAARAAAEAAPPVRGYPRLLQG
jgi:hypothetical protein